MSETCLLSIDSCLDVTMFLFNCLLRCLGHVTFQLTAVFLYPHPFQLSAPMWVTCFLSINSCLHVAMFLFKCLLHCFSHVSFQMSAVLLGPCLFQFSALIWETFFLSIQLSWSSHVIFHLSTLLFYSCFLSFDNCHNGAMFLFNWQNSYCTVDYLPYLISCLIVAMFLFNSWLHCLIIFLFN